MTRHKWDAAKSILLPLPLVLVAAYALDAPLPIPAPLLPERRYLALGRAIGAEAFRSARGRGEAYMVLAEGLAALPPARDAEALEAARRRLPEIPVLGPVVEDLGSAVLDAGRGFSEWRRARLLIGEVPLASELAELDAAAEASGEPLDIEVLPGPSRPPVQALSRRYGRGEDRISFELLLGPGARSAATVEVAAKREGQERGLLLYSSPGGALPADFRLRLSAPASAEGGPGGGPPLAIETAFVDALGTRSTTRLLLAAGLEERPRVLVISEKGGAASFIDRIYPSRRASPAEAAELDLLSYELVVVDGLPISKIGGALLEGLLELSRKRTGSILFAADAPEFGKAGDNPRLEEILPVTLLPRSVKDLPDMAVLILIDSSGSMFGDKLSLAKVTGLELLRNLKPGDLVGLVLFSDSFRWAYEFEPNSSILAVPLLEPLGAKGGTDMSPALAAGLERLSGIAIKGKHAIIISDGVTKPADFQALAELARANGITISAMGVGEDANRPLLERLALGTGGRYYPVVSAEEIPALVFEDRESAARPNFLQGRIPILDIGGGRVAEIGGMAQYAPRPAATVLFANELGDPLLAERRLGNRAVLLFASDLYGTYTADFFGKDASAGVFKEGLDALFAEGPAEIVAAETARGVELIARSDRLVQPRLLLSRRGFPAVEAEFRRTGPGAWAAEAVAPDAGEWNAVVLDRGGSFASFPLFVNGNLAGVRTDAAKALYDRRPAPLRLVHSRSAWLLLFFAASLASSILLRMKR